MSARGPLRVGVGGPVGSGKTALVERLCKRMRDTYDIAVVTNDIYTKEDAEFLTRAGALAPRHQGRAGGACKGGSSPDRRCPVPIGSKPHILTLPRPGDDA